MNIYKTQRINRREFLWLTELGGLALLSGCMGNLPGAPSGGLLNLSGKRDFSHQLSNAADVELSITAQPDEIAILPGSKTQVWRYQGTLIKGDAASLQAIPHSYLGPIIRARRGQNMRIHFTNKLPQESIIHWHGLHVPESADGHPRLAIQTGETYTYEFTVNDRAGMYWFHPHPHGRTGPQVYAGLAGLFIVSDDEEQALNLPSGDYEIPLVILDRLFDQDNQLNYARKGMAEMMTGFLGDRILVNGQDNFKLSAATRAYRLRLLNGSNSRIYKIAWEDGSPLTIIGTDGGLLEKPVQKDYITLAPAQRLDVWVDFSQKVIGDKLRLVNLPSAVPDGRSFPLFEIQVDRKETGSPALPDRLSRITLLSELDAVNQRSPRDFFLAMGMGMSWTINGRTFDMMDAARDEVVRLGDQEVWQFSNQSGGGMGMMAGMALPHPMHIHGLQFQVLERTIEHSDKNAWDTIGSGIVDEGWHDTVLVMPGERVKILLKFEDYEGLYLYHCHNLEHEDMGMMRNFRIKG